MATGLSSTRASKYCFWRLISSAASLLLGDVDHAALDELRLPVLVAHRPRLVVNPDRPAVGGDHAVLAHPDAVVLGQRQIVLREDPVAVVRVEDGPVEVGIGPGLEGVPEHGDRPLAHVLRAVLLTLGRSVHGDRESPRPAGGTGAPTRAAPAGARAFRIADPTLRGDRSEQTGLGRRRSGARSPATARRARRSRGHSRGSARRDTTRHGAPTRRSPIESNSASPCSSTGSRRRSTADVGPSPSGQRRPRVPSPSLAEEGKRDRLLVGVEQRDVGQIGREHLLEQGAREVDERIDAPVVPSSASLIRLTASSSRSRRTDSVTSTRKPWRCTGRLCSPVTTTASSRTQTWLPPAFTIR